MVHLKPSKIQQLLEQRGPCKNREEYFARTRFKSPWKYVDAPQEVPKPLIEMETHNRNNMSFDAIDKRDKEEALAEAL